ncbi:ATP-binding protein [Mesorhizobium sp. M0204]|uniref:AAA family ATPase n=1 Tax=Mesorhizobium sp. M0204 TaxID=2956913 RepID=UPI00333A5425
MNRPTKFSLVGISTVDVGPLRGKTFVPFLDPTGNPTNVFLIMGKNGAGKTTILDAIYCAMSLLRARTSEAYGHEALDSGKGAIQLDALVQLDDGRRSVMHLISMVAGADKPLKFWTPEECERIGVYEDQQLLFYGKRLGYGPVERSNSSSPLALEFAEAIIQSLDQHPLSLWGTSMALPTVLYFHSDRGLRRPPHENRSIVRPKSLGYSPAHLFGPDGTNWAESIENLLVWFAWLGDDREKICREIVNDVVFKGTKRLGAVDRNELSIPVETASGDHHRLDQLSSGERQLVQLAIRIAAHMTGSTIVLIDETEQHLHTVMRRRLINILKSWAQERDGLSFVLTSHQTDSMRLLAPKTVEDGLFKSGCLVKPKFRSDDD